MVEAAQDAGEVDGDVVIAEAGGDSEDGGFGGRAAELAVVEGGDGVFPVDVGVGVAVVAGASVDVTGGVDPGFPERNLILFLTFAVIVVTLVGQGLTLPWVLRRAGWDGTEADGDEATLARATAYQAGLDEIERARPNWPDHGPLLDRLESGLTDRTRRACATENPTETAERRQERIEHEEIQRGVIGAQRAAVIELRDRGAINDQTLRTIERELDLEELRMEG